MNSYKSDEMSMRECARTTLIIIVALMLCSCRSTRYIPVETTRIDTMYIAQVKIDSVYHRDSIHVETKGDSVTVYKEKQIYKIIELHDTIEHKSVDTVKVIIPETTKGGNNNSFKLPKLIFLAIALFVLLYISKRHR